MGVLLTETEMDEIAFRTHARVGNYHKNENISPKNWGEGTIGLLQEGIVYLCVENERYERNILQVFRPGDMLHADMLIGVRRGVSYLIAKYPSRVLMVREEELKHLARSYERWRTRLETLLVHVLPQRMLANSYMLHQRSPRMKLLAYFRQECALQETNALTLPMPFSDLAEYLGVDRSAMMKEMTRLKQEGIVTGTRRSIVFHDMAE